MTFFVGFHLQSFCELKVTEAIMPTEHQLPRDELVRLMLERKGFHLSILMLEDGFDGLRFELSVSVRVNAIIHL